MAWGGCGFGAPTGQTIRWELELLLLKTHLPRCFQLYTGPVIFWFELWDEALALVAVWEVVYVVWQEQSSFCIPSSAALGVPCAACDHPQHSWCLVSSLGCPTRSLCPSRALGVVSGLLLSSYRWRFLPSVGKCFSLSVRIVQTSWRKSVFDFGGNTSISLGCFSFFP